MTAVFIVLAGALVFYLGYNVGKLRTLSSQEDSLNKIRPMIRTAFEELGAEKAHAFMQGVWWMYHIIYKEYEEEKK